MTGSGTTYTVAVSGMTGDGTVDRDGRAGVAQDAAGNANRLDQHRQHRHLRRHGADGHDQPGGGQADPTNGSPINFTVVFSEPVTGFATGDVTLQRHGGRDDRRP